MNERNAGHPGRSPARQRGRAITPPVARLEAIPRPAAGARAVLDAGAAYTALQDRRGWLPTDRPALTRGTGLTPMEP